MKYLDLLVWLHCREQAESSDLDIMTGFRLADPCIHLVCLEGLRKGAGKDIDQYICSDMLSGSLFTLACYTNKIW